MCYWYLYIFKYTWPVPIKDKTCHNYECNAFQQILDESGQKPNITWVDKDTKFYNRSLKSLIITIDHYLVTSYNIMI